MLVATQKWVDFTVKISAATCRYSLGRCVVSLNVVTNVLQRLGEPLQQTVTRRLSGWLERW